jgi:hypothetical protein
MSHETHNRLGRRGCLQGFAAVTGAISLSTPSVAGVDDGQVTQPAEARDIRSLPAPEAGYQSLGPDEVGFVEALVNVMCPADHLTPNGVDCGLAIYIDRQLAGGFGKGASVAPAPGEARPCHAVGRCPCALRQDQELPLAHVGRAFSGLSFDAGRTG